MIAGRLATLAAVMGAMPDPAWAPVGVSHSHLHIFVERASVRDDHGHRFARVRIGSPGAIAGPIVLVYQDEEVACGDQRWRLLGYDARDAAGATVERSDPATPPGAMLPAVPGTIGGEVVGTVCAFVLVK